MLQEFLNFGRDDGPAEDARESIIHAALQGAIELSETPEHIHMNWDTFLGIARKPGLYPCAADGKQCVLSHGSSLICDRS